MSGDSNSNNSGNEGRSLGGVSEPLPATWARPTQAPRLGRIGDWSGSSGRGGSQGGRQFGTVGGLGTSSGPASGPEHSRDNSDGEGGDESSDQDDGVSWFAGGERSGISIQNPEGTRAVPGGNIVRDLLRRAAEAGPPRGVPSGSGSLSRSAAFTGGGHTLGSDDVESSFIPDANAPMESEETAIRHLTLWRDGFSIEDDQLMRYDDPENARILAEINAGRAPPSILNVATGQPVELRVAKRTEEDYVPPKGSKAFVGSGHRLGAPVPGFNHEGGSSVSTQVMPGSFPTSSGTTASVPARESITTRFEVDQTEPTTSIQIRLADGTRMVCRMNLTHTVADIRDFINASHPGNLTRPYTIGTTFPNRTLEDDSATIKAAGLINSVIVQRWV